MPLGKVWYGSLSLASSLVCVCPLSTPGKKNGPPFSPDSSTPQDPSPLCAPSPEPVRHPRAPPPRQSLSTPTSPFPRKRKGDEVVRVLSKPSSTEAPFVCDPRRPPLWPRTLTLAAAAAAPPHVPVGVARRARTPSAPCLATESRGRGEISGPERILIVVFGPENRVENAFQGAEGKIIHLPEALKTEIRRSALEVEGSCVGSVPVRLAINYRNSRIGRIGNTSLAEGPVLTFYKKK